MLMGFMEVVTTFGRFIFGASVARSNGRIGTQSSQQRGRAGELALCEVCGMLEGASLLKNEIHGPGTSVEDEPKKGLVYILKIN